MKRAQGLPINTIVIAALGLLVLVILAFVIRNQIAQGTKKYTEIGKEAEIKADKCASIILNRACNENACDEKKGQRQVYSPAGEWADCKAANKQYCCEGTSV